MHFDLTPLPRGTLGEATVDGSKGKLRGLAELKPVVGSWPKEVESGKMFAAGRELGVGAS